MVDGSAESASSDEFKNGNGFTRYIFAVCLSIRPTSSYAWPSATSWFFYALRRTQSEPEFGNMYAIHTMVALFRNAAGHIVYNGKVQSRWILAYRRFPVKLGHQPFHKIPCQIDKALPRTSPRCQLLLGMSCCLHAPIVDVWEHTRQDLGAHSIPELRYIGVGRGCAEWRTDFR